MATALLIVGAVLAAGPLIFLGRMWRHRWRMVALVEVVGALLLAAGFALHLSVWGVVLGLGWALGFGVSFGVHAGKGREHWVVVATGLAAVVVAGAVGYGVIRTRFKRTAVTRESTGQALTDYRKGHKVTQAALRAGGRTPPPGVYEYAATGSYWVSVKGLGTDKRVMPAKVPAVLTAQGNCWELTVRYFKQHHWTIRYCNDPKRGLLMKWLRNINTYFGLKNDARSVCEPEQLLPLGVKPPTQWTQKCRPKDPNPFFGKARGSAVARYVGVQTVVVGGEKVRAHYVHRTVTVTGLQAARVEQHLWYSDSNMMLKFKVHAKGKGFANFVYDYGLTLLSLSPKR